MDAPKVLPIVVDLDGDSSAPGRVPSVVLRPGDMTVYDTAVANAGLTELYRLGPQLA